MRQAEVLLHLPDGIKERFGRRRRHKRRRTAAQTVAMLEVCGEKHMATIFFVVDERLDGRAEHTHRTFLVPHRVDPVSEVLPLADRQLQHAERRDRRRIHLQVAVVFRLHDEVDEPERHVGRFHVHLDHSLVWRKLEAHGQALVPFPSDRTSRIGRPLVHVDELDFIVERTLLRHGEQRRRLGGRQAFLSSRLNDQRLCCGIVAQNQPERRVLQRDIATRRRKHCGGQRNGNRRHYLDIPHFTFASLEWSAESASATAHEQSFGGTYAAPEAMTTLSCGLNPASGCTLPSFGLT